MSHLFFGSLIDNNDNDNDDKDMYDKDNDDNNIERMQIRMKKFQVLGAEAQVRLSDMRPLKRGPRKQVIMMIIMIIVMMMLKRGPRKQVHSYHHSIVPYFSCYYQCSGGPHLQNPGREPFPLESPNSGVAKTIGRLWGFDWSLWSFGPLVVFLNIQPCHTQERGLWFRG